MDDPYKDSFLSELDNDGKKAVRAAVLRFVQEFKEQLVEMSNKTSLRVVTGEAEVTEKPQIILQANNDRKMGRIINTGMLEVKVYSVDDQTTGGYTIYPKQDVHIFGNNAIAVATVSGVSRIEFLDS